MLIMIIISPVVGIPCYARLPGGGVVMKLHLGEYAVTVKGDED